MSRREKTLLCPHCVCPVAKVRLAKFLERIWSLVATNRQGLPFCGPLLPGIDRPSCLDDGRVLDLFQIMANIRALQYQSALTFAFDIREVLPPSKTFKIPKNISFLIGHFISYCGLGCGHGARYHQ